MTLEIGLVLGILIAAMVLLITEWFAMEVVALLVLCTLAITGLVPPLESLAGFSNPAVITVWAVFILSSGLTRAGVANMIGRWVLRMSGSGEAAIIAVVMVSAGVMSAFMNNVAVAALMLPVVMDIGRQTGVASSRLLMPLAYGSLLGGLTTQIGTPPNLLVSGVLIDHGLPSFGLFDFTPVGAAVMVTGTLFMVLVGRHLLPKQNIADARRSGEAGDLPSQYQIEERLFTLTIPPGAGLVGRSLARSRLGSMLGINVLGINRRGRTLLSPPATEILEANDELIVEGSLDNTRQVQKEIAQWSGLNLMRDPDVCNRLSSSTMQVAEITPAAKGGLVGRTLRRSELSARFGINVLSLVRDGHPRRKGLQELVVRPDDMLLVQGSAQDIAELGSNPVVDEFRPCPVARLIETYRLNRYLLTLRIPSDSLLEGRSITESRLGTAVGVRLLALQRGDSQYRVPIEDETLQAGDCLLVEGGRKAIAVVRHLSELELAETGAKSTEFIEDEKVGLIEAILHPHSQVTGRTLADLHFRERFGLSVLSIWRKGQAYRDAYIRDMPLQLGDALLLYGPRENFAKVGGESDYVVLTESAQEVPEYSKAKWAVSVMVGVLIPVVAGWIPIYISALLGAAAMVITGCLTMEQAHRAVEWKGIILIAGMLPLGTALESSGAAHMLAQRVVELVGPLGPMWAMGGLMALTFLGTCVIPTAALVVLMGPIVVSAAGDLGVSPQALVMAIAIAASASFMTPISHPANIMVMGPGGYKFTHYIKVGLPLTLVVLGTALLALPRFWPL